MDDKDNLHQHEAILQRVRCRHCHLPLVQIYQGNLLYTLQDGTGASTPQPIPAYLYRTLTDPTPLFCCPPCEAPLSPAAVTVITVETRVAEEKKSK